MTTCKIEKVYGGYEVMDLVNGEYVCLGMFATLREARAFINETC